MTFDRLESDILRVLDAKDKDFETTVRLAGLDPRIDLRGADLAGMDLSDEDLQGFDLSRCNLANSVLDRADLTRVNLRRADLSYASLKRARLPGACLRKAKLFAAVLTDASLDGAILVGADLRGATVDGASFAKADMRHTILDPDWSSLGTLVDEAPALEYYVAEADPYEDLVNRHIAARLKLVRIALGLTQRDLATIVSVSTRQLQKHEFRGVISVGLLHNYAKALAVSENYFFEGLDEPESPLAKIEEDNLLALVRNFMNIKDQNTKKAILFISRALAKTNQQPVVEISKGKKLSKTA